MRLVQAIDKLISDLEDSSIMSLEQLLETRKDADKVHQKGFYFFNLHAHRTLALIELQNNRATVLWAGSHEEYISTFKNNKHTIEKWLRSKHWIS